MRPQTAGQTGGVLMKNEARAAGFGAGDLDIRPVHASLGPQTSAESLRGGFFGSKTGGVMHRRIGTGITVGDLARGEGALFEALSMPLEQLADASHLDEVDAGAVIIS